MVGHNVFISVYNVDDAIYQLRYSFAMSFDKAKKLIIEAMQKGFKETDITNALGIMKDLVHSQGHQC